MRERIRTRLTRGKVECNLRFEPDASAQGELILNEKLAKQLVNAANWVKMQSDEGEINPVDILRWPGVMAAGEQDLDAITAEIGCTRRHAGRLYRCPRNRRPGAESDD